MRYYSLKISGGKEYSSGSSNRTPINVQFNLRSFLDSGTTETGFIRLYNPPPEMYIEAKSYINKSFIFRAGWESTPLTSKLSYLPILNDILVFGRITGVLGDYSGTEPYIDLYYSPTIPKKEKDKESQLDNYTIQIKPRSPVVIAARNLLKKLVTFNIVIKPLALTILNKSNISIIYTFIEIAELLNWLRERWGIYNIQNPKTNVMYLLSKKDKKIPSGAGLIRKTEFLTQPQILSLDGSISAVIRLRPDLIFGSLVVLEPGMIPSFSTLGAGLNIIDSKLTNNMQKLFKTGTYTITSIEHTGEFYNPDPSAWSTQLTLVPYPNFETFNLF